jgi:hypothetical protein
MQRRKFVVGLGSLAAGASAVMGTGALSKTEIDRGMTGVIAPDTNSAYVSLAPSNGSNNNGAHVDTSGTEITLDFTGSGGNGGDGLNANSKNWFDRVFKVTLNDPDSKNSPGSSTTIDPSKYDFWITKDVKKRGSRLDFYRDGVPSSSIVGSGNAITLGSSSGSSYSRPVGVMINLMGLNLSTGDTLEKVFGSDPSFRVHIEGP